MTRTIRTAAVALAAAAAVGGALAGPAAAKTVEYKGKTAGGHTITFKRSGNKVWWISTMVPTTCLPIDRIGARVISGAEIYTPPGYEIVGRKVVFEDLQKPALWWKEVTKHYEVTLRRGSRGALKGSLHLTFSFIVPTYPMPTMITYGCVGKTTFTARPR